MLDYHLIVHLHCTYQTDPLIVLGEWLHVSGTKPYPYALFFALSDIQNAAATRDELLEVWKADEPKKV
jgi:hypothetical protein